MSERVVVRSAAEGTADDAGDDVLVAVKLARDHEEAVRLDREAAVLAAFRHPGLVRMVGHVPGSELVTARVGERDAARSPAGDLRQALARTAALAALTADLHDRGLVHGAISPDHVLLTPDGRPVLCSLHLAGPPGEPFPDATPDPAFPAGAPRRAACDVHGIGTVLADELAAARARPLTDRRTRRAAERLVRSATHVEPSRRPGAGALAAALARLAGTDAATSVTAGRGRRDPADRRPRRPIALAPAAAAVLAVLGAVAVVARGESGVPSSAAPPATLPSTTTTRSFPDPPPTTPVPGPAAPPTRPPTAETPTEPPTGGPTADPPEIEHDGARYRVGEAGDRVATGDWDCDGVPTVALLRPSTGAVFVFPAWADTGGTLDTPERTRLPGATDLRAAPRLDGCDDLELATPSGARTISLAPGGGA